MSVVCLPSGIRICWLFLTISRTGRAPNSKSKTVKINNNDLFSFERSWKFAIHLWKVLDVCDTPWRSPGILYVHTDWTSFEVRFDPHCSRSSIWYIYNSFILKMAFKVCSILIKSTFFIFDVSYKRYSPLHVWAARIALPCWWRLAEAYRTCAMKFTTECRIHVR